MIAALRSPLRLLVLGAVLLWVVTPLLLGGLVTLGVHAGNGGSLGAGMWAVLVLGGIMALVVLLFGFGALLTGVVLWWRARTGRTLLKTTEDSASSPPRA